MSFKRLPRRPRPLSVLASALAAAGLVLAAGGCARVTPIGPDPAHGGLPPARHLGSPINMQIMRGLPPTSAGKCPAGSIDLFGSEPNVARAQVASSRPVAEGAGNPATPTPSPPSAPSAPLAGVACYRPVGTPVTVSSAGVSSVATRQNQPGPAWHVFVVAFPSADVPALTALIRQAYDFGDSLGMSVAGKLWQAPQPRSRFIALKAEQVNLLSGSQAVQLHRLLVSSG